MTIPPLHQMVPVVLAVICLNAGTALAQPADGPTAMFDEDSSNVIGVDRTPCWVPFSLFPARRCAEVRQEEHCGAVDFTASWDEECAVCRSPGGGYPTQTACEAVRAGDKPPDTRGDKDPAAIAAAEAAAEIDDFRDAALLASIVPDDSNGTIRNEGALALCRLSLAKQLEAHYAESPTGRDCPHDQSGLILWHDATAWTRAGGQPPKAWSDVMLPERTKVLITSCSITGGTYTRVDIPATSELIFADENIAMDVGAFHVYGALSAGGPSCRRRSRLSIQFHERWWQGPFNQGIMVKEGGTLDLHGRLYSPTWTRLSSTAKPGTFAINLAEAVNWAPGQQLLVTTTIWRDEWQNQNEVRTIKSVEEGGRRVVLTQALLWPHYGGAEYQAEVGLLSRSITLSSPLEAEKTKRGGHVHVRGEARMRGVLAFRMGQTNVIAAYPFHFHLLGPAYKSYVQDCAVWRSFYRGVVLHGTSQTTVADTVAFDVTGSCFYLEDGVEEDNVIDHNLAAYVHVIGDPAAGFSQAGSTRVASADLANPIDAAAAGFYIPNTWNTITRNAASGGWAGFSMPRLTAPVGSHRWIKDFASPAIRPVKRFSGNSAHSSGYMWQRGACIYAGGDLRHDPARGGQLVYTSGRQERDTRIDHETSEEVFQEFTDTKVFLCQRGLAHWGKRVKVDGYKAYDITRGATLFGEAILNNAVIVGRSKNGDAKFPGDPRDLHQIAGFQWYDTDVRTIITNTIFKAYPVVPGFGVAWTTMVHSDHFKPMGQCATMGISYEDVLDSAIALHPRMDTGSSRFFNWIDYDGSATKRGRSTLLGGWPSWWKTSDSGCQWKGAWGLWLCDHQPWRMPARLDIRIPGYTFASRGSSQTAPPTKANHIGWVSQFGQDGRRAIVTRNEGITGVTGDTGWYLHLNRGAPKKMEIYVTQVPVKGSGMLLSTRYPRGTSFTVKRIFQWFADKNAQLWRAESIAELQRAGGEAYHFDGRWLTIKIADPGDPRGGKPESLEWLGIKIQHARWYSMHYTVEASCDAPDNQFCDVAFPAGRQSPPKVPDYTVFDNASCVDMPAPGQYPNCVQQAGWGHCDLPWMAGHCDRTCGRCASGCSNIAPTAQPRCDVPSLLSKCDQAWVKDGGFCDLSCGRCDVKSLLPCENKQPTGDTTCSDVVRAGNCGAAWVRDNDFCAASCLRCGSSDADSSCHDVSPSEENSCTDYVRWGACSKAWLRDGEWCLKSCGRCPAATTRTTNGPVPLPVPTATSPNLDCGGAEELPVNGMTCSEVAAGGLCDVGWATYSGVCTTTCGANCTEATRPLDPITGQRSNALLPCVDVQPWGAYSCFERRFVFGQCGDNWMLQGGFCAFTCGYCAVDN